MNEVFADDAPNPGKTGQVADDRALALAVQALQESEARFRSALRAGRMGSWETDYHTMTRRWTAEGMELFGLALPGGRGQVGGPHDEYASALHPDDRHLAQRFHALADEQDSFPAEYRIVRSDGTQLWLSGRGLVVERRADGRALRLVSIMADATERKQAEERLRIEHERLEAGAERRPHGRLRHEPAGRRRCGGRRRPTISSASSRDNFVPTPGKRARAAPSG